MELVAPPGEDREFNSSFPTEFGLWGLEDRGRVRETILEGDGPDLSEPGPLEAVEEGVEAMSVEDVGGAKPGNHAKQTQLALVENGTGWQGAGEEMDGSPGGGGG